MPKFNTEIDLDFKVLCDECRCELDCDYDTRDSEKGNIKIIITPCKVCSKDEKTI